MNDFLLTVFMFYVALAGGIAHMVEIKHTEWFLDRKSKEERCTAMTQKELKK